MALRPIWIASQGLTIGLTPIVVAIQGLWPDEEDEQEQYLFGGGGARPAAAKRRTAADRAERRRHEINMQLVALTIAIAEDFLS